MKDYLATFTHTDGAAFPNTATVDATTPGSTDGTEVVKLMIDDFWGFNQALMNYANLTPDGVQESAAASQRLDAIGKGFSVGPGLGVIWWLNDDPATTGHRVLLLNGQGVLRASYPLLDAAVYVGDTDNPTAAKFYHADDAAGTIRNTAGVYLILPDLRGYTLRGLDTAAAVDPDGASRTVGSVQLDASQNHDHFLYRNESGDSDLNVSPTATPGNRRGGIGDDSYVIRYGLVTPTAAATLGKTNANPQSNILGGGTPRTATETRMINVATRFGITY